MDKFYKSKKFKYGSSATLITVVVVAAVVVLNVIITALGAAYLWYTDLTTQNYYKLSDEFQKEFDDMMGEEGKPVNFNFVLMMDEDRFSTYNSQTLIVYNTIKEISKKYDNVKLKAINSTTYPELVEKYKFTYGDTVSITDVVIELADENFETVSTASVKKYAINAFFVYDKDGNLYGYNAEARILSAFAQMLGKDENRPVAYYLIGHGEPSLDTVSDTWGKILDDAGYEVVEINLQEEDFSDHYDIASAGDYNNCIVIINDPKFDLYVPSSSGEGVSEVKKIREFFGTGYGNLIAAVGSTTPDLPALNELLSEFGMGYGGSISDSRHSIASSEASKITADYDRMAADMSLTLKNELFGSRSTTVPTVFESPSNVYVVDTDTIHSNTIHGYNGSFGAYPLFYPYASATTEDKENYNECFMGVYYSTWDVNDDNNTRSYAFVIGSTEFLSNEYTNTSMNRTVMNWILSQIYDEMIYFEGVNFVKFTNGSSLSITDEEATAWTIATIVAIPVVSLAAGTVVWFRRRHS
ncbi:MAG: hypothetical protein J5860_04345 [Clostridia bacterium]|nr:hypothetical protein [Clostridia bacterium]MBO4429185.1 hypothetical protein [Clostridia bacterium]